MPSINTSSRQHIQIGAQSNDGTGDSIRTAFLKVNQNFTELYYAGGGDFRFGDLKDFNIEGYPVENGGKSLGPGNQFITTVNNGSGTYLVTSTIVGGVGISVVPAITSSGSFYTINNSASSLLTDPNPTLGANLVGTSSSGSYRAVQFGNPIADQDLVTRKFLYDNFLNRDGQSLSGNETTTSTVVEGSTLRHNIQLLTTATSSTHIVNKDYADSKISLDGIARNAIYGTMTGPLLLSRNPVEGDSSLQAATKGYVDDNAYFSENNLHISTKGSDYQPNTPASKRGRNWQYAFNTLNHAAEYAEQLIAVSRIEVGDYARLITYGTDATTPCTVISINDNFLGNNLARLALFAGDHGSNQFGSAPKGKFTIFPGQYIQGVESEAIALIEGIATENGQEIYTVAYVDYGVTFNTALTAAIPDVTKPKQVEFTFSSTKMVPIPSFWIGYKFFVDPYQTSVVGTIIAINSIVDTTGVYHDSFIVEYTGDVPVPAGSIILSPDWHVYSGDFLPNETVVYNTNVSALQVTFVIESGEYNEQFPIKLPNNTSIRGDEFRRVIIRPAKGVSNSPWATTYFRRDAQIDRLQTVKIDYTTDYATNVPGSTAIPSAVSGFITIALSTGSLPLSCVGYMFVGNSGQGIITAVIPGGFAVDIGTALTDTGTIASGQWHIYKPVLFGYHYLRDPSKTLNNFITQLNPGGLVNAASALTTGIAFIQQSVVTFMNTTYGVGTFNESLCRRDVGTMIKSLAHDMYQGGAGQVITSADFVAKIPSLTTGQCAAAVNYIKTAVQSLFASNSVEPTAQAILNDMINAAVRIINNDTAFNPPKLNSEMDVFMCNDANVIRYVSCQNHGGFMMVLDPSGQIKNKSPYTQTASSFSQSIAKHRFAGGMFIDGFAGNVIVTPTKTSYVSDPLHVTVTGLRRKQQVPTFFSVRGVRYEVDFLSDFAEAGRITYPDGSTVTNYSATLNLNPLSPGGIPNTVLVSDTVGKFQRFQNNIPLIIDQPSGIGGLGATGHATSDLSGKITSVVIDFPGTGYLTAPNISIGGAVLNNLTFAGDGIASASIVSGGSGYAIGCQIEFIPILSSNTTPAIGVVTGVDSTGAITGFAINTPGTYWALTTQYQIVFGNLTITVPNPIAGFIDVVPSTLELITAGNRSMLANDFTQVNDLGYGIFATNGGFAENVSMFTYYNYRSYYSLNGAQMRTTTGSSCYGEYGLCAEGSDPNEVPVAVNVTYPLTQIAKAYVVPPLFPATLGQTSLYITTDPLNGGYPPMNGSQLEINHSGIIRTYSVGTASPATDSSNNIIPNVYQLFFNSGNVSSGSTTGLYASLRNNDTVIIRAETLIKLRGVNPSVISRPSTSLTYNDDPTYVYHITGFSTVQPDSSVFVYTLEDYNYITFQTTEQGVTYPIITNSGSGYTNATVNIQLAVADPISHNVSGDQGVNTGGIQAIYLNSVSGIKIGQTVTGNSIIAGTVVTYINATNKLVGISYPTSNTTTGDGTIANGTSLTFTSINPSANATITNGSIGAITITAGGAGWTTPTVAIGITGNANINSPIKIAGIAGSSIIKINPLELLSANRILSGIAASPARYYQVAIGNQLYNIVGYRGRTTTGQAWAEIDVDRPLVEDIGKGVVLRAGFPINSAGSITTRISLLRATGHDFVDIGTGGYADTRIPNDLYGPPINIPKQSNEVIETNKARVYYMTTDQDGNFRVGAALTVNQAKGSVSISVPLDISNLSSIGLRRDLGPPVNEFSVDSTMVTEADYKVPTEQAVVNYINRRLGLDRNGNIYSGAPLGPQFLDLRGLLKMKGTLDMSNNNIANVSTPRAGKQGDAANKDYADSKISLKGTLATDTDNSTHITAQGEMDGPLQLWKDPDVVTITLISSVSNSKVLPLSTADINGNISTKGHIYGPGIPDGTLVTGIDYALNTITISNAITGAVNTQFYVDPIVQAATKRYVDKNKQFNQLSDVSLVNATNQDFVMFGPTLVVNTSTNPAIYNAGTQVLNVANDITTIVNTPTSRAGGSDITVTRSGNTVAFKLVGGLGSSNPITDYHINNDAQIQQSKLLMTPASVSASAPSGTQRNIQLNLGVAQFNNTIFTANNGWISLADATTIANGINPSKMTFIPAGGGLLGATNTLANTAATYVSAASIQTWLQNISSPWAFSSNLTPNTDLAESLGTNIKRWGTVYANTAILNSGLTLNTAATIGTDQATANMFTTVANVNIGASSGVLTINNPTVVGSQVTQNVYNTVATTVNAFGSATAVNIGASSGVLTINNPTVVGSQVTQNVYNTVATTVNAFGSATAVNIGSVVGTTNVNNNAAVQGTLGVNGQTTLANILNTRNILPTSASTYDIGAATNKYNNVYAQTLNGTLNVNQLSGVLPISQGGTGASTTQAGIINLFAGLGTPGAAGYVLKTSGLGTYYWAAESGASSQVGTTINSSRLFTTVMVSNTTTFNSPPYIIGSGQLRVYINGIRQNIDNGDYTETTTNTFTTSPGRSVGDLVMAEVDGYISFPLSASTTQFNPAGNLTSNNVQNALQELDSKKVSKSGDTITGDLTMSAATITLAAGTTAKASIIIPAGALLTTKSAGALEFNGTNLYVTLADNSRVTLANQTWVAGTTVNASNSLFVNSTYYAGASTISGPSGVVARDSNSDIFCNVLHGAATALVATNNYTVNNLLSTGRIFAADGSAIAPSIGFTSDIGQDTGLYWGGDGNTNFTNNGVYSGKIIAGGTLNMVGDIVAFVSDMRLKDKIGNITNAVDKVNMLSGFYYTTNELGKSLGVMHDRVFVGVSAQEVNAVMPEAVRPAPFDSESSTGSKTGENYMTVQYEKLVPLLIESIKELSAKINTLQNEIEILKTK